MELTYNMIIGLPAFRVLLFEIIFTALICVMEYKSAKRPDIEDYLKGIRNLLILFMPTVAFVELLNEIHVPEYLTVLSWIVVFAFWFSHQIMKGGKQILHFFLVFGGIEGGTIAIHFILYYFSK